MIPPKILEQIEAAARNYAGREQPEVEHAFDDGAQFGFQLAQEIYGPVVEALKENIHWIEIARSKLIDADNWPANLVLKKSNEALSALAERLGEP